MVIKLERKYQNELFAMFTRGTSSDTAGAGRRLLREAVAAAVHDRLVPQELRGPHVPFERKIEALTGLVRQWLESLRAQDLEVLDKLADALERCPAYRGRDGDTPAERTRKRLAEGKPCGRKPCPQCHCRAVERALCWLSHSDAPTVQLVASRNRLSGFPQGPSFLARSLKEAARHVRRVLSQQFWVAQGFTRCTAIPDEACDWPGLWAYAVCPRHPEFTPAGGAGDVPHLLPDPHSDHYSPASFGLDAGGLVALTAASLWYPEWAMSPDRALDLAKYVEAVRGFTELKRW